MASPSQQNENLYPMSPNAQAENVVENTYKVTENADNSAAADKQAKSNVPDANQNTQQMPALEYKYAPANFNTSNDFNNNYFTQQNMLNSLNQNNYNLGNYNDQSNYDLYYQSLYQMYPQMSDVIFFIDYFNMKIIKD